MFGLELGIQYLVSILSVNRYVKFYIFYLVNEISDVCDAYVTAIV